jgi:hypothetical protein
MNRKQEAVTFSVIFLILNTALYICAQAGGAKPSEWQGVEQSIGRPGQVQGDGAYKLAFPRNDLKVTLEGVDLKPALALGGWVAFSKPGTDSMVMGDLVLTEDEVATVMASLESGGIQVTAVHNHLQHESPRVIYMHIGGHGDAVKLATSIKEAIAHTAIPASKPAAAAPADIGIDTAAIEQALGFKGKVNGGVFQVGVPRAESITEAGMKVPNSMGLSTALNFQPTGGGKAAITGDFVLIGTEVNSVIQALHGNGINVTALHSHMLDEQPKLFFMHFWANDDAVKLAKGLRAALDKTNSQKSN